MTNNDRTPVSTPQQSAQRASVDTDEFRKLANRWASAWTPKLAGVGWPELIAHINAWGSAGSGATQSSAEDA